MAVASKEKYINVQPESNEKKREKKQFQSLLRFGFPLHSV